MLNLLVDLGERFSSGAGSLARERIARAGYTFEQRRGADDRTLAWMDVVFGGSWSSEAHVATNVIASLGGAPAGFASFDPAERRFAWLRGAAANDGVLVFGPLGVDPLHEGKGLGASLVTCALAAMRERGARQALIAAVGESLVPFYERVCGARIAERFDLAEFTPKPVRTVVLASGNGSNFQAVLDRVSSGTLPLDVCALVTNRPGAYAIERARTHGVRNVRIVPWKRAEATRAEYDLRLLEVVGAERPELVLLLGWMHVLDAGFVRAFPELINVHPAYLPLDSSFDVVGMPDGVTIPAFRGAHAVRDALEASSPWVGASVHGVTEEADRGPVLARRPLLVRPGEDEAAILERLHPIEHQLVERGIKRWLYER